MVDDKVDTATNLADLLSAFLHDTRTAHDGPTPVEATIEYLPDVV